jgi:hypothetical protein
LSRRGFLRSALAGATLGLAGPAAGRASAQTVATIVPLGSFRIAMQPTPQASTMAAARDQLLQIGRNCVVNKDTGVVLPQPANGDYVPDPWTWIRPSQLYPDFYSRDTFWILAALQSRALLGQARRHFHGDQKNQADGHVATALRSDLTQPPGRDPDDESTLMDVLREYEYVRLGGAPDMQSLAKSYSFIKSRNQSGLYATHGDPQTGAYHYWADTFATKFPQAIAYNQGLYCVALEALDHLGMPVSTDEKAGAQYMYATMAGSQDPAILPQRLGGGSLDVSAFAGDALFLYYFGKPLLPDDRVKATFDRLLSRNAVYWQDRFTGFRVLSYYDGSYMNSSEFIGPDSAPGYYQNGGSWLLYDALALYSAAAHGIIRAGQLMIDRVLSEFDRSHAFHEFTRTAPFIEDVRPDYGWNAFVARLIA